MGHRYIDSAIECVAREQCWTNEELQAFGEFERHVRNTDVQDTPDKVLPQTTGAPSQSGLLTAAQPAPETQRARVREAYAETVLETTVHKHIHEESLAESLFAEFGPEIAASVLQSEPLTPELRSAVFTAIDVAQTERTKVFELYEDERTSLTRASELHGEVETTVSELDDALFETWQTENLEDAWDRLLKLEVDCERLIRQRQELLHDRSNASEPNEEDQSIVKYLYRNAPFTYPVLAVTAEYLERLQTHRQQLASMSAPDE